MNIDELPTRDGSRPTTTPSNPHTQLEQIAPTDLQDRVRDYALSLPRVRQEVSHVSVPGTVAFFLDEPIGEPIIPDILGGEWGHIHPHYDGSLHMQVPIVTAEKLINAGWAEHHTLVGKGVLPPIVIMVYGPRDEAELKVVKFAVDQAYAAAGGLLP